MGADVVDTIEEARNVKQARQQQVVSDDRVQTSQPQLAEALKCPRCDSSNTKFCYYNNYNMCSLATSARHVVAIGPTVAPSAMYPSAVCAVRSFPLLHRRSNVITRAINKNMPTSSALTSFPNVLSPFMSTGFEFSLPLAPPLSFSGSVAPAPALAPGGYMMTTPSFLDLLKGGVLDHEGSGGNGVEISMPPLFGLGVMQHGVMGDHHGVVPIGGGNATGTTQRGGQHQWAGAQHGYKKDDESAAGWCRSRGEGCADGDNKNRSSTSRDNHRSNGGSMSGIRGGGLI
ncbi:hypothetical protein EJB05_26092, partial [Eragrostis curvula]